MTEHEKLYLQEMGISLWQVSHPERLMGYESPSIVLPDDCQLLLVAPSCPIQHTAVFFEKVLKSMQIELAKARHITPEQLGWVKPLKVNWVWFAGCAVKPLSAMENAATANILQSPELSKIDGNTEHRRELWQQIRSYE
ncbi:DNA polymerase III subunit psi [Vibrio sp. 05-20-BW147]|uniref:DNA polymerase III subunit psi n=1 Tax=Vibrio sp. 05-20-BW147 TaxID=2575834 RepID=UPI00159314E2|nr:DNA polymerase III subunit psi [Vibrio sp. 05-20-BW147]NVC64065.1 DNA polymerase III subunit psi [Vibrio sp. 05-20-BW147]